MSQKELKYSGFSAVPSDYECADGSLAASVNLITEDNQLKPLHQPQRLLKMPTPDYKIVFVHETNLFTHYIIRFGNTLFWINGNTLKNADKDSLPLEIEDTSLLILRSFSDIIGVNAIGNTLIVMTSEGLHYLLWKGDATGYLYLGTHLPELPISFGLQGEVIRTDTFSISFDSIDEDKIWDEFSDENKSKITPQILAKVNKFIADNATNAGKFMFPFLVRYAYRLYDGNLTMHSSPVLMVCSSDIAPVVFYEHITGKKTYTDAELRVFGVTHILDYAVLNATRISELQNWKDIVRSVDIFITKPIYTYDQNGECKCFKPSNDVSSYCICKHINQAVDTTEFPVRYQLNTYNKLYAFTFDPTNKRYPGGLVDLPARSTDQVKADIRAAAQFYLLKSIPLDELSTTRTAIAVEEDYLQSLVARELMTDDYDSHDTLIPQYSFAYNSRLNIANLKKRLYNGFNMGAMFPYTDGYVANWADVPPTYMDNRYTYGVYFFINQDGKDIIVSGENYQFGYDSRFLFFYYPNVNAYKAVFWVNNYFTTFYEVPLEAHGFLNGAFYFGGWENVTKTTTQPTISSVPDRTIELPNKIYTSEVNNPFYFPVTGINTVGTGIILGISSAAKALSEGQFGQFPLYAFTSEGVWALEVSSTGSYSARQPITRDVCINPDSITQIDSAVLFATDRGIMLISGSNTTCITDVINSETPFNILSLSAMDKLHAMMEHEEDTCFPLKPFSDFLSQCGIIYDYVHQHIVIYNPNYNYSYVYSISTKQWGMLYSKLQTDILSYPEALAMDSDGYLVDFTRPYNTEEIVSGLAVSRPFKLDAPDTFKTIDTIIQRGYFRKGHVKSVLYGSRDLFSWHLVWSSKDHFLRGFRGTPYKYYRVALLCNLSADESIYGATVQYTPKLLNCPR